MKKKKKKEKESRKAVFALRIAFGKKKKEKKHDGGSVFMQALVIWCADLIILAYQEVNDK